MLVKIDAFKNFKIGEKDKTLVQCSSADLVDDEWHGFIHLPDVWLNGIFTFTPNTIYDAETSMVVSNDKLALRILSFKNI